MSQQYDQAVQSVPSGNRLQTGFANFHPVCMQRLQVHVTSPALRCLAKPLHIAQHMHVHYHPPDSTRRRLFPGQPNVSFCSCSHALTSCTFFLCTTSSSSARGAYCSTHSCPGAGPTTCGAWLLAAAVVAAAVLAAAALPWEGTLGRRAATVADAAAAVVAAGAAPAEPAAPDAAATGLEPSSAARALLVPEPPLPAVDWLSCSPALREARGGRGAAASSSSLLHATPRGRDFRLLMASQARMGAQLEGGRY